MGGLSHRGASIRPTQHLIDLGHCDFAVIAGDTHGNYPLAIGALLERRARGIDVPGQISLPIFDDIELAAELAPKLATVRVPSAEIGRTAARRLLARLAGKRALLMEEMAAPQVLHGTMVHPARSLPA